MACILALGAWNLACICEESEVRFHPPIGQWRLQLYLSRLGDELEEPDLRDRLWSRPRDDRACTYPGRTLVTESGMRVRWGSLGRLDWLN